MWPVLVALVVTCVAYSSQDAVRTFSDPVSTPGSQFNHLVVDRNTGRVYIGAVNKIYQLSPDLEVDESVSTGPINDSTSCIFECPANYDSKPTDNTNKILVIDYAASRLITCGSVLQGLCSVRNLNNISSDVREVREALAANSAEASTVAFIAPGPPNAPVSQVLYVGVTFTGNSPYRSEIPTVSSRSLEDDRLFLIASTADRTGTRIYVNSLSRERYPINYVFGFSSEGFSYFLTTQLRGIRSDLYYSKLVRVCHNDENYYSYTEIPITCSAHGGHNIGYNLVQAAYVGKAGSVLAGQLGITPEDDVLFAAFSQSHSTNTNTPTDLSALCVYSLKAIRRKFTDNIKSCFNGIGSRGLDFITPSSNCISSRWLPINEDFCGVDVNTPLGGDQPVEAVPVAVYNKRLTAVAATVTGENTVVFAGTAQGHLKKIVVENATSSFEYGDITVDEGSPVNKDLFFDPQLKHLYVMTGRKVSKVKIEQCNVYKSQSSCLETKDPYCKWCPLQNKCSELCTEITRESNIASDRTTRTSDSHVENWKFDEPKKDYSSVNPVINDFEPKYGPQSGGTDLRIIGEYLNAGNNIKAYIDDSPCTILTVSHDEVMCRTSHSNTLKRGTLRMHFDDRVRSLERQTFEYVEDPVVESVESGLPSYSRMLPKGIVSGGIKIKVMGRNFHSIFLPQIYVYYDNQPFIAPCYKENEQTELICESPAINADLNLDSDQPLQLEYGFIMDDVVSVQNLSMQTGDPFLLYPDPVYEKFDENVKHYKYDYLTLNGDDLDKACSDTDIEVRIGGSVCNITSLSRHQLTCRPPSREDLHGANAAEVVVKVGRALTYNIGTLWYS